jgi:hypothetical protein
MKLIIRSMKPIVILGGLLLALPMAVVADKPDAGAKGGKPNRNSVAITAACTVDNDTARVCSCKGLSNVVLWCGSTWVKHEDFGSAEDTGEVFDTTVDCGVDGAGKPIPGPITMIAIKSGSQKNAKHHPEGYKAVEDAPSGSGLFTTPQACSSEFVCPVAGDCTEGDEPPGDEPPGDEPPGDEGPPILG